MRENFEPSFLEDENEKEEDVLETSDTLEMSEDVKTEVKDKKETKKKRNSGWLTTAVLLAASFLPSSMVEAKDDVLKPSNDPVASKNIEDDKETNRERLIVKTFHDVLHADAVDLGHDVFAVDINRGTHCYKVMPEDLQDLEKMRCNYQKYVEDLRNKKIFKKIDFIESARHKTEKGMIERIKICKELKGEDIPNDIQIIRKAREEEIMRQKTKLKNISNP
jgi:hypothetical protein